MNGRTRRAGGRPALLAVDRLTLARTASSSGRAPGSAAGPWRRYVSEVDPGTGVGTVRYPRSIPRDAGCAGKLKARTLTNLYNAPPAWLTAAHRKLDVLVAAAYGWPADLTDDEMLSKLLSLNLERAAVERQAVGTKGTRGRKLTAAQEE